MRSSSPLWSRSLSLAPPSSLPLPSLISPSFFPHPSHCSLILPFLIPPLVCPLSSLILLLTLSHPLSSILHPSLISPSSLSHLSHPSLIHPLTLSHLSLIPLSSLPYPSHNLPHLSHPSLTPVRKARARRAYYFITGR